MSKLDTLKKALAGRDDEILNYQINIDNFRRAIAKIEAEHMDKPEIVEFRDRLKDLLRSNEVEQLKAKIIRDVIAEQVAEMEN